MVLPCLLPPVASVVGIEFRGLDIFEGSHILNHQADLLSEFMREFHVFAPIERRVKFLPPLWPWRTSRRSLPFLESWLLLLLVCQCPSGNEGRLAGVDPTVRPQMMQAGSNPALVAYRSSPETLPGSSSDRKGSAVTILSEPEGAGEV